jgi:hypothetical protein
MQASQSTDGAHFPMILWNKNIIILPSKKKWLQKPFVGFVPTFIGLNLNSLKFDNIFCRGVRYHYVWKGQWQDQI